MKLSEEKVQQKEKELREKDLSLKDLDKQTTLHENGKDTDAEKVEINSSILKFKCNHFTRKPFFASKQLFEKLPT